MVLLKVGSVLFSVHVPKVVEIDRTRTRMNLKGALLPGERISSTKTPRGTPRKTRELAQYCVVYHYYYYYFTIITILLLLLRISSTETPGRVAVPPLSHIYIYIYIERERDVYVYSCPP